MTIKIVAGWWLLPLAISVLAFGYAAKLDNEQPASGDYGFGGLASAFVYGAAAIVSLTAWLTWSLFA